MTNQLSKGMFSWILLFTMLGMVKLAPVQITSNNFQWLFGYSKQSIQNSNFQTKWFVMFHSPNCGHCKKAIPEFTSLASEVENIKLGFVDCVAERDICEHFGVRAFPHFLYFKGKNDFYKYVKGDRSKENLHAFLKNPLKLGVQTELKQSQLTIYLANLKHFWKELLVLGVSVGLIFGFVFNKFLDWFFSKKESQINNEKKQT